MRLQSATVVAMGFSQITCLPASRAAQGEVGVAGVGRGDDDRVHLRVVENDRRVGVGAFDFEVGGSELESARVHITERHDVGLVSEVLAQAAAVGSKPAAAGADNSEAQAVVAH